MKADHQSRPVDRASAYRADDPRLKRVGRFLGRGKGVWARRVSQS